MFKEEETQYCPMCEEWAKKYDQLKVELEQEKALKETYLACYKAKHEDIEGELFKLKAENEKLDTENKRLVAELANPVFDSFEELDKYKQALQEIKEIAEQMNNECFYDDFDCKDCDMKKGCTHFNKKQILQKCEVIKE